MHMKMSLADRILVLTNMICRQSTDLRHGHGQDQALKRGCFLAVGCLPPAFLAARTTDISNFCRCTEYSK